MLKKIKNMLHSNLVKAGLWSISGNLFSQIIRLASNLIMTRILVPEMFGVMSIANTLLLGMALLSDVGLKQNIVHSKRGDEPIFLNTVWSIQILRGVFIWLIALFASAGLFMATYFGWITGDSVYSEPILPIVIAVISFTSVITGFDSTKLATAVRKLDQKRIVIIDLLSQIIAVLFMIIWAYIDRTIWALVVGNFVGVIVRMVLSHTMLSGNSNHWKWDPTVFKEVFQFGKWIFLSSFLTFLLNNGDRLMLGGMVSAEVLGIYSIALMMVNVLQNIIAKLNWSVVFPSLSEVFREKNVHLKHTYYKYRFWMDLGILFSVGFLLLSGNLIIEMLYDERYAEAGYILQVLSLTLIVQRYSIAEQVYLAMGKSELLTILNTIRVIALYSFVPIGFHFYGFDGALWAIVLAYFSSVPISLFMKFRYDILDIKKELITLPVILLGLFFGWLFVSLNK